MSENMKLHKYTGRTHSKSTQRSGLEEMRRQVNMLLSPDLGIVTSRTVLQLPQDQQYDPAFMLRTMELQLNDRVYKWADRDTSLIPP
eukprot:6474479-Amphidinium_carterae.2